MDDEKQQPQPLGQPAKSFVSGSDEFSVATAQAETLQSDRASPDLYADSRALSLLFNTQGPAWKYIVRAGLISLLPSLVLAALLSGVGLAGEESMPQFSEEFGAVFLFVNLVVVSPVIETLLLALTLWLVSRVTKSPLRQALVSCVLWAVLHSLVARLWGLTIVWPFFVFSCAYLAWRRKSRWHAMGVACGIHMFQNLLPGIAAAFLS